MDAISAAEIAVYEFVKNGVFRIDSEGRIWRGHKRAENRTRGGRRGYLQLRKMVNGHRYHVSAHRIVWMHFKNNGVPAPAHLEINHDNGIKSDNRPLNLLLDTASGNMKHAYRTGLKDQRGQKNPAAKLTDNQVAAIRTAYAAGGYTQAQLAATYGVTFQCVSKIVRGVSRSSNLGATGDYTNRRQHGKVERRKDGRFGKKAAGRLLDGKEHNEYPEVHP